MHSIKQFSKFFKSIKISIISFAALCSSAFAGQLGITELNLIPGIGDMEANWRINGVGENWSVWNVNQAIQVSLDKSVSYSGGSSQRILINKTDSSKPSVNLNHTQEVGTIKAVAQAGQTYTISYYLKTSSPLNNVYTRVYVEHGVDGTVKGGWDYQTTQLQSAVGNWTKYSFSYTVPTGCNWFRLMFNINTGTAPASGSIWIDNVAMTSSQAFPALINKPLRTYALYPYNHQQNWAYYSRYFDGGRWGTYDPTVLLDAVRPDAVNAKGAVVAYTSKWTTQTDSANILPYSWVQQNHPEWFLKDLLGNLIGDSQFQTFDIGNPSLQQEMISRYLPLAREGKFKYVMWDGFDAHTAHNFGGKTPVLYPTDALWQAAVKSFLQNVAGALRAQGTKVLVNLAHIDWYQGVGNEWLQHIDGGMIEIGVTQRWNSTSAAYIDDYNFWIGKYKNQQWAEANGKVFITKCDAGDADTNARRFAIASFLLNSGPYSYFTLCSYAEQMIWHPDLEAPLGNPIESNSLVTGNISNGGIFKRAFENGLVLVNPSATSYSYNLTSTYRDLDNVVKGPGTVTLAPKTALILIGSNGNGGDQTAPTVSFSNPLTSGGTYSGAITLQANANDNVGVTKVEFYINGALKSASTSAPYTYWWDTRTGANGSYTLTAKAYDAAGNFTVSPAITVNVSNRTMSGKITLDNCVKHRGLWVELQWLTPGTNNIQVTRMVQLDDNGNYTINVVPGTYDIKAKAKQSLRTIVRNVNLTSNNSSVNFSLVNGDVNNDNVVNQADKDKIMLDYGRMQNDQNGMTDLYRDIIVNDTDIQIVNTNLNKTGTP